jgi:hypothetical protein
MYSRRNFASVLRTSLVAVSLLLASGFAHAHDRNTLVVFLAPVSLVIAAAAAMLVPSSWEARVSALLVWPVFFFGFYMLIMYFASRSSTGATDFTSYALYASVAACTAAVAYLFGDGGKS